MNVLIKHFCLTPLHNRQFYLKIVDKCLNILLKCFFRLRFLRIRDAHFAGDAEGRQDAREDRNGDGHNLQSHAEKRRSKFLVPNSKRLQKFVVIKIQ